jgi:hypothetical protein
MSSEVRDEMNTEEIHAEILASGAITLQSDDGFIHHIIRKGTNMIDFECAPDGNCTLQVNIGDEVMNADGANLRKMTQVWRHWLLYN